MCAVNHRRSLEFGAFTGDQGSRRKPGSETSTLTSGSCCKSQGGVRQDVGEAKRRDHGSPKLAKAEKEEDEGFAARAPQENSPARPPLVRTRVGLPHVHVYVMRRCLLLMLNRFRPTDRLRRGQENDFLALLSSRNHTSSSINCNQISEITGAD